MSDARGTSKPTRTFPPSSEKFKAAADPTSILVVDGDGVSRRFVEVALSGSGIAVEAAKDATSALEILHTSLIGLVLCETDLADMNGLQFYRRLSQENRLRGIPFAFFSADKRTSARVVAYRAGVDDFITKPCEATELSARVTALLNRSRRMRDASAHSYSLAGDLKAIGFAELAGILEMGQRTGVLSIATRRAVGELYFDGGNLVHVTFGNLVGDAAFYRMLEEGLAQGSGQFEFSHMACPIPPQNRSITESLGALIMEGTRVIDERTATGEIPAFRRPDSVSRLRIAEVTIRPAGRAPALSPAQNTAAQFEAGIGDGFSLGELVLLEAGEIERWSRADSSRERFHIHLVADGPVGVSQLLSIAAPAGERCLLTGMSSGEKALAVTFFLRHERVLDILLVDIQNAGRFQELYARQPSLVVLAPLSGDWLTVGTKSRAELENYLVSMDPTAVLAIGNAALERALRDLGPFRDGHFARQYVKGALGEGTTELRQTFIGGIRLWSSAKRTSNETV